MPSKPFPNLGKVDMKLKAGILIILLLGIGLWWIAQPKNTLTPGQTTLVGSGVSTAGAVTISNVNEAVQETATAAQGTKAARDSIDEALEFLSS